MSIKLPLNLICAGNYHMTEIARKKVQRKNDQLSHAEFSITSSWVSRWYSIRLSICLNFACDEIFTVSCGRNIEDNVAHAIKLDSLETIQLLLISLDVPEKL